MELTHIPTGIRVGDFDISEAKLKIKLLNQLQQQSNYIEEYNSPCD